MSTLLPNHEQKDENDITAGQLLCGGMFSNDGLSNWLSSVALTHGMMDQEALKTELLKVQVASIQDAAGILRASNADMALYTRAKKHLHTLLQEKTAYDFL